MGVRGWLLWGVLVVRGRGLLWRCPFSMLSLVDPATEDIRSKRCDELVEHLWIE